MFARVRTWFDGAGWFVGGAAVLFFFAILGVFISLKSPDLVLWTGQGVSGTEQNGIVTYQWHGQSYPIDVPGYGSARSVTVYLDPGDPSHAMVDNIGDRIVDGVMTGGPVVGCVVLLAAGAMRSYRMRRKNAELASEWWLSRLQSR